MIVGLPDAPAALRSQGLDPALWGVLAILAGLIGCGVFTACAVARDRRAHGTVFRRLAGAARLRGRERRMLRAAACQAGFVSPACVLVSRGAFDHATRAMTRSGRTGRAVDLLRARLFPPGPTPPHGRALPVLAERPRPRARGAAAGRHRRSGCPRRGSA